MKRLIALLLLGNAQLIQAAPPDASGQPQAGNPFVEPPKPRAEPVVVPAINPAAPQPAGMVLSGNAAMDPNRAMLDQIVLAGVGPSHATIKYPMQGAGAGIPGPTAGAIAGVSQQSFRVITLKHGQDFWLAGRKYKFTIQDGNIAALMSGEEVVWQSGLDAPRTVVAPPSINTGAARPAAPPPGVVTK